VGVEFSRRLGEFRKARGLTQKELADKIRTTQRMIAYYENPSNNYIPTDLIPAMVKALKVSADNLLGLKKVNIANPDQAKLWRRLKKAEQLSSRDQKTLFTLLEALLAGAKKQR